MSILSDTDSSLRGQITMQADETLKAPENVIQSVYAAKSIYHVYRTEHLKRIELYAYIEGLIAGNPPYDSLELAKHGLSHIANFNTLDGRSLYERAALAYWNLLNEAETICKFTINSPDPEARRMEDVMSKEWDFVVRKWDSFETLMNNLSGQLVKFGISPLFWPDERDWRWRVVDLNRFFIADQTQSDIDQLTCVCVENLFTAQYLFEAYETFKDVPKAESPWNCEALSYLLLHIANSSAKDGTEFSDFLELQRKLQNGDIGYDNIYTDAIRIVSLFYKEYDGGVSHYMFHRTFDNGEFLYFADRQYKAITDAVVIFTASPGESTIHSNRGLGHKIFSVAQAMMQLDCAMVDAARWASTPLLRSPSTGSRDFQAIRYYPGVPTNIGTSEFQQNNMGSNINQMVGLNQYLLQKLMFNTANSGDDPSIPDKSLGSISPTQARMQSFREFGVLKNNIAHYYCQFDGVVRTMVIRMLESKKGYPGYEYAKEWKERCLDRGVAEEMFDLGRRSPWGMPRQLDVKATRVAGDGSTLARILGLQEMMSIAGDFGPRESKEYKRQYIMATMGNDYVPAFMQEGDDVDEISGGASLAGVENNSMQNGQSPIFSKDNEHKSHFAIHMALATNTIQNIQQQKMTPVDADKIFTVLVPHIQEHYAAASRSPFARVFVGQNKKPLGQVIQYATMNRKNAEEMIKAEIRKRQEQQKQTQAAMTDEQIKMMKVKGDEERANFKVQSQVQRAAEANDTRAEIMREKIEKDSDNQRLKIKLEATNKQIDNQNKSLESKPENDLRAELDRMNGSTPAPADIEGII
jgi:hypothetical protein